MVFLQRPVTSLFFHIIITQERYLSPIVSNCHWRRSITYIHHYSVPFVINNRIFLAHSSVFYFSTRLHNDQRTLFIYIKQVIRVFHILPVAKKRTLYLKRILQVLQIKMVIITAKKAGLVNLFFTLKYFK